MKRHLETLYMPAKRGTPCHCLVVPVSELREVLEELYSSLEPEDIGPDDVIEALVDEAYDADAGEEIPEDG